jgi:hypothetical protein
VSESSDNYENIKGFFAHHAKFLTASWSAVISLIIFIRKDVVESVLYIEIIIL